MMKKEEDEGKKNNDFTNNVWKEQDQDLNSLTSMMMMMTNKNSGDRKTTGSSRPSVSFHNPDIPRPQDEFNIFVNNTNHPFEHVWLQKSADGTRFVHPLENLHESDFIDRNTEPIEPIKPLAMENTPLVLVEEVKELKQLAAKLRSVNEFAVDLEHNQYRSFQGMTCLMQISTRTEDFVVDTPKLRVHVGPYLREVFKDASKRKVMHGADRDIVWLQRDFGIYVCNLFDTHQASRLLGFEKNSLENLLLYFFGVAVNKTYQNADWRVRPLPDDMLKYAREDTHYLLFMYDLMTRRLLSASMSSEACNDLLLEGLCEWRDAVARAEDESTGYILPNRTLLEIAKQMPLTVSKLRRLVKSKHPYVDVNLESLVDIIKNSIQNAAAFESTAQQLEKRHLETVIGQNVEKVPTLPFQQGTIDGNEVVNRGNGQRTRVSPNSILIKEEYSKPEQHIVQCSRSSQGSSVRPFDEVGEIMKEQMRESFSVLGQMRGTYNDQGIADSATAFDGATEEVVSKASNDFGLGKSSSKPNLGAGPKVIEQDRELDPTVTWRKTEHLSALVHLEKEVVSAHNIEVNPVVSSHSQKIDDGGGVNVNGQRAFSATGHVLEEDVEMEGGVVEYSKSSQGSSFQLFGKAEEFNKVRRDDKLDLTMESFTISGQIRGILSGKGNIHSEKALVGVTKEALDKPSHDCELAICIPESKFDAGSNGKAEQQIESLLETLFSNNKKELTREGSGRSKLDFLISKLQKCFKKQNEKTLKEGDQGFKSLLNDSKEESNDSPVISRFRVH